MRYSDRQGRLGYLNINNGNTEQERFSSIFFCKEPGKELECEGGLG